MKHNPYNKYKETSFYTSNTQKLIMLFEGIIKFLLRARGNIINNEPEEKFSNIYKVIEIINGMKFILDYDKDRSVAEIYEKFYDSVNANLNLIILGGKPVEDLDKIINEIKNLKTTWEKVDAMQPKVDFGGEKGI